MSDATQRRGSPRQRFSCKGRFRDPRMFQSGTERLCITRDFSRDGVYFITDGDGLREDMQLVMRFPESAGSAEDHEYLVEIKRMNSLAEDRWGVGARLILRTMIGQMDRLVMPKVDLTKYGCLYQISRIVDVYV